MQIFLRILKVRPLGDDPRKSAGSKPTRFANLRKGAYKNFIF